MTALPMPGSGPQFPNPFKPRKRGLLGASASVPLADMTNTPGGPVETQPMPQQQPQARPSFFGEGGTGRAIAGNVGDFLLQYSGMQPIYQPAMQQRQEMAYKQQQAQRKRLEDWTDWQRKQQWERDNPKPVNNDTVADYEFWQKTLTPQQFNTWLQNRIDPPQYRQGADGRFYRIETPPTPPQVGAIEDGYRFKGGDPANKNNWEPVSGGAPPISAAPPMASNAELARARAEADEWLLRNGIGQR